MRYTILDDEDWREGKCVTINELFSLHSGYQTMVGSCISAHCSCIDAQGQFWLYEIISRPEIEVQIDLLAQTLTLVWEGKEREREREREREGNNLIFISSAAISCDKLLPRVEVREGLLCSAQSSVDGQWHRAYVEKVHASSRDKVWCTLYKSHDLHVTPCDYIPGCCGAVYRLW